MEGGVDEHVTMPDAGHELVALEDAVTLLTVVTPVP